MIRGRCTRDGSARRSPCGHSRVRRASCRRVLCPYLFYQVERARSWGVQSVMWMLSVFASESMWLVMLVRSASFWSLSAVDGSFQLARL